LNLSVCLKSRIAFLNHLVSNVVPVHQFVEHHHSWVQGISLHTSIRQAIAVKLSRSRFIASSTWAEEDLVIDVIEIESQGAPDVIFRVQRTSALGWE
jgi:hypothetical protein